MSRQGDCVNFGHVNTNIANECRGYAVAQLFEVLHYRPEGSGFGSRWSHWNFSLTYSFWLHYGPGVDSACNRNEYQGYLLGVKAAGA